MKKIVEAAEVLGEKKPKLSKEIIDYITEKTKGHEAYFPAVEYERKKYMSISTAMRGELEKLKLTFSSDLSNEVQKAKNKAIRDSYDPFFSAIRGTLRNIMCTITDYAARAAIAMYVLKIAKKKIIFLILLMICCRKNI